MVVIAQNITGSGLDQWNLSCFSQHEAKHLCNIGSTVEQKKIIKWNWNISWSNGNNDTVAG